MGGPESPSILEDLPPEKLLETNQQRLINAGVQCMHDIDEIREYVAFENTHENRRWVLRMLHERAEELRGRDR